MTDSQIASIHAASDDMLIERLFTMIRSGEANNDEYAIIDSVVYDRFARAYGQAIGEAAMYGQGECRQLIAA
jgi:hypothetical protein